MFEFLNNRIYFSALIKSVSTLIKFVSTHHIYCIFKSINEVTALDDERDISDFSDSSNNDFQKFLPTNIRRCC